MAAVATLKCCPSSVSRSVDPSMVACHSVLKRNNNSKLVPLVSTQRCIGGKEEGTHNGVPMRMCVRCESSENNVAKVRNEPRRAVDRSETLMEDPYGQVSSCMTSPVITTTPDTPVEKVLPHFEHYTGIPVVDDEGHCVGIISNIDVAKFMRAKSNSLAKALVSEIMTSPAFVIDQKAPIAYAAGLMLQHKVHRLPVVDKDNVVIGIITRTDIYEPLLPPVNPLLHHLAGEKKVRTWNMGY